MLKISRSARNKKLDREKAGRMAKLADEQEALITAIEEEKLHLADLEREIRKIEKQVASQRLKVASGRNNCNSILTALGFNSLLDFHLYLPHHALLV